MNDAVECYAYICYSVVEEVRMIGASVHLDDTVATV